MSLRENEPVRVSVRAPVNATAWGAVNGGGQTYPLVNTTGNTFATDVAAGVMRAGATLYVARNGDTVHLALTRPTIRDAATAPFIMLGDAAAQNDTDATIIGRSTPAGTYKWMFVPGTIGPIAWLSPSARAWPTSA